MKSIKKAAIWLVVCFFVSLLIFPVCTVKAADILPTASNNLCIGLRKSSKLTATNNGYMRVFYDGKKIGIEYYDDNFMIQSKKSLDMELELWGGFYAGSDAYYLVEGQKNTAESDTAEVIRVIKYDTDWNRTGTAKITGNPDLFGGVVRYPFDYGCVEMAEYNGTLYIVTGHQGYVDPAYNQGHQGFLMIAVDESTMVGNIVDSDLWHSFAQYIVCKDSDLYVLEQSEGSRYTQLSKYDTKNLTGTSLSVLKYGGSHTSAWAIPCFASVNGIAASSDNILCLGTSIDQSQYDSVSTDTPHNIYLTVTPISNFSEDATSVKWLTNYNGDGKSFLGTNITMINDNRFMVSWEESGTSQTASTDDNMSASILHYIFLDGAGNIVSKEFTEAAPISDCQPIVKGTKVVYYASNANMVNFYSIDTQTGEFSKKAYRVAGENATWNFEDGVLTISGIGAISLDTEDHHRYPLSSTSGVYYFTNNSVWTPIDEYVKKIVIEKGITDIPESTFENFDSLTEVDIESGLVNIGKKAFYECDILSKITIPSSVTSIGEDFLWTGYIWYDTSHVVDAVIYAPQDSYAITYAKENGISYQISDGKNSSDNDGKNDDASDKISILTAKVSGINKSYVYNGKEQRPEVTVKLDNAVLEPGTDYTVSYVNNTNTGKATVKINGINNYDGTIEKTFKIVPKKATITNLKSPKTGIIKITWQQDSQATGYQIQYAENTKFTKGKKNVTIANKSTVSKNISKLKKGKKYYIRIRAYKEIDGKKCYGSWSKSGTTKSR